MAWRSDSAFSLVVSAAVFVVTGFVVSGLSAALITAGTVNLFGPLWFVFPFSRRR